MIETQFTVQVNIVMGDVGFNQEAKQFSGMVVPVGYFEIVSRSTFSNKLFEHFSNEMFNLFLL